MPSACAKIHSVFLPMQLTGRRSSANASQGSVYTSFIASTSLSACATFKPPAIDYDRDPAPAVLDADPPKPVKVVPSARLCLCPGQLKPQPAGKHAPEPKDPAVRVAPANEAARVQPTRDGYLNAVQVYPFTEGALYKVYTAAGQVTDLALQESEQLVGSGPDAASDTVRWGRYGKRHRTVTESVYSRQAYVAASHDQSRHQHRPADLSSRAQIDRENLYGLCLRAISAGPAHRRAPAKRGGASGYADLERD
jgi:hypothetical protein